MAGDTALPELARDHASIVAYAVKYLRLKLASPQNVLSLLPASLTLQEVRLLLLALEQASRQEDAHGAKSGA